jgi:hypothetical protein
MEPVENRQERGFPTGSTRINLLSLEKKPESAALNLRQPSTESDQGQRATGGIDVAPKRKPEDDVESRGW